MDYVAEADYERYIVYHPVAFVSDWFYYEGNSMNFVHIHVYFSPVPIIIVNNLLLWYTMYIW